MFPATLLSAADGPVNDALSRSLQRDLDEVGRRFSDELRSDLDCVNALSAHVQRYRGKMLRPALLLLSARAAGELTEPRPSPGSDASRDALLTMATVVEMVHMATLVHDDILDEAEVRRGGATINRLAGNESAVMLGDYLISHAYHLCSCLRLPWAGRVVAAATNTVCEGELLQLHNRGNWALDESTYREIIRRKTASLCGVCCRVGARLVGVDEAVTQHLGRYGEQVGEAFQIVDDLLDLTGEEHAVGKTLGRDVEKGKLTLPLLRMLASLDDDGRAQAVALLGRLCGEEGADTATNGHRREPMRRLAAMVADSGAVEASLREAWTLVERAKACLVEVTPDSPARQALLGLADRVVDRGS